MDNLWLQCLALQLVFLNYTYAFQFVEDKGCQNETGDLTTLLSPCRYDPLAKPPSTPLLVTARMYVYYIQMARLTALLQFKMQVLVQLRWRDERLRYNGSSELMGDKDRLWLPQILFSSEHQSRIMGLNKDDTHIIIKPSGDILFSRRLHTQLLCHVEGGKFPFDLQQCHLLMYDFMYNTSNLALRWEESNPVQFSPNIFGLSEFDFISHETTKPDYLQDSTLSLLAYSGTNKSSLLVVFHFARKFGFYFWDYYAPSVLLVVTSWGTFFVDPEVVSRVWWATSTMLALFGLGVMNDAMPKLSQLKMNDIWFIGCNLFIFLSLAEFAFVNIVHRQATKAFPLKRLTSKYIIKSSLLTETTPWKRKCPSPELERKQTISFEINQKTVEFKDPKLTRRLTRRRKAFTGIHITNQEMAHWIDCRSRTVFPLAFLVFNLLFWILMFI